MTLLGGSRFTWLGHATMHIQTAAGTSILVDPWFQGNPSSPKNYELPAKIDLLLLTHGHDDHFHDALEIAKRTGAKVVGIYELTCWLGLRDVSNLSPMNYGGNQNFRDVRISMVEARHSSSIADGDKIIYAGSPCGFVLKIDDAPVLYLAGDTSLFDDMKLFGEIYMPEIAVLPIGDNFTMGPEHAAIAARYLGAKTVIPVHYGTFPALTGTPEELCAHLAGSPIRVLSPKPGETIE